MLALWSPTFQLLEYQWREDKFDTKLTEATSMASSHQSPDHWIGLDLVKGRQGRDSRKKKDSDYQKWGRRMVLSRDEIS